MKKILFAFALLLFLACNNEAPREKSTGNKTEKEQAVVDTAANATEKTPDIKKSADSLKPDVIKFDTPASKPDSAAR